MTQSQLNLQKLHQQYSEQYAFHLGKAVEYSKLRLEQGYAALEHHLREMDACSAMLRSIEKTMQRL